MNKPARPNPIVRFVVVRPAKSPLTGQTHITVLSSARRDCWDKCYPPGAVAPSLLDRMYSALFSPKSSGSPALVARQDDSDKDDDDDNDKEEKEDEDDQTDKENEEGGFELDDSMCSICFQAMDTCGEMDGCKHRYCLNCLLQWSQKRNWCPTCRQEFVLVYESTWRWSTKPAAATSYKRRVVRSVFRLKDVRTFTTRMLPGAHYLDTNVRCDNHSVVVLYY
ncbi:hypothetical protein BASA81_012632 [Batrachochytrium salamandrivorans]|nr:hypothetical protein BASA81_012632 [Batrachochytrium salamandrivorans]